MGELKIRMASDGERPEARTEEHKKLKPVVKQGDIVSTKRPMSQRIGDNLLANTVKDSIGNIVTSVVIPGVQNAILDSLSILFFNKPFGKRSRSDRGERRERYSYDTYYRSSEPTNYSRRSRERDRERYYEIRNDVSYKNIVLRRMDDAQRIVEDMHDCIRERGYVSVSDLFEMLGMEAESTDLDWGWRRTGDIGMRVTNDGYLIDVNNAVYLR